MTIPVAVDEMRAEDELSLPSSAITWGGEACEEVRFGGFIAAIMTLLMSVVAFADTFLVR